MKTIMLASALVALMTVGVTLAMPSGSGSGFNPRCECIGCVRAFLVGEFSNLIQNATIDKIKNCAALSGSIGSGWGSGSSGSGPKFPSGSGSGSGFPFGSGSGSASGAERDFDTIPFKCIRCVQEFLQAQFVRLNQTAFKELSPKNCSAVRANPPSSSNFNPCMVFTAVHGFFMNTFKSLQNNSTQTKCGPLSLPSGTGSGSGSGSAPPSGSGSGSGSGAPDKCFVFTVVRGFFAREFFRLNMIFGPKPPSCSEP